MSRPANVAAGKCRDRQMSRPAEIQSANVATGKCRDRQKSDRQKSDRQKSDRRGVSRQMSHNRARLKNDPKNIARDFALRPAVVATYAVVAIWLLKLRLIIMQFNRFCCFDLTEIAINELDEKIWFKKFRKPK